MKKCKKQLTEKQKKLIETMKNNGLFEGFFLVVRSIIGDRMPRDLEEFLVKIMTEANPKNIPKTILARLSDKFGGKQIKLFATQGIGIIKYNGDIVMFISVVGMKLHNVSYRKKKRVPENNMKRGKEIETKFGRTFSGSAMLQEINNRTKGEFAIPCQI